MNRTSEAWPARVRRAWIERVAHATGRIGRKAVMAAFGVCEAQASADIQAVLVEHPGCLAYDLAGKCYRWAGGVPMIKVPYPIDALHLRGGGA